MDGYRDLYRAPVSAGFYTSPRYQLGYGIEGRSSYALSADPLLSAYARAPLDAYAGYAAYQPELLRFHRYAAPLSPRRHSSNRRRPAQTGGKSRPTRVQNLAPKKTPFKKTRKGLPVEMSTPKKASQQTALHGKPSQKEQKAGKLAGKSLDSSANLLAKETQELHSLYRTGVDPSTGKKLVKPSAKKVDATPLKKSSPNARGQKRKADIQKMDEAPSSAKKSKGKKKKKLAKKKQQELKKDEKPVVSTPKAVNVEPLVSTEEVEASLALQNAACKAVGEFLGIADEKEEDKKEEVEEGEVPDASTDEAKLVEGQPNSDGEVQAKVEEPSKPAALTPDEEKELEEEGYKFFSKFLEENQDLRNLYLEKKDAGTFECLVCRSVDPETSKKFANLTNLVMHTSMRKQKRPEHLGYGRAICDVLGWESLRTPKRTGKQVKQEVDLAKQSEVEEVPEEEKPGES